MKIKNKSKAFSDNEIKERQKFLDIYNDFDKWLHSLGFRSGNYRESSNHLAYNYSHYNKKIDSLYGVEVYINEVLNLVLYFNRDRYEHKFMFVGEMGMYSEILSLVEMMDCISKDCRKLKEEILKELELINV
jgi:hypothetical protein